MDFVRADESIRSQIEKRYSQLAERHLHFEDGFTLAAIDAGKVVGFASFVWRDLVAPLDNLQECFIDIIEVASAHRREGIASRLLVMAEEHARRAGAYQIRAWSSSDKVEALAMWAALHFGLTPATVFAGGKDIHGYFATKVLES